MVSKKKNLFVLMMRQRNLRKMAARQCELFQALHQSIEKEIVALEDEIRWERFIEYCNTPCWRY